MTHENSRAAGSDTARAESLLGACLSMQGRFEEAEPLLIRSFNKLRTDRGEADVMTQNTILRIIHLYETWERPDAAAEWREKLVAADD